MISLRDVVTGFGNRDPLAEVWRRSLRGGGGGSTVITGVPPLRYIGDGIPLTDYLISGNTVQDGTPSADAPVEATGSGVRTAQIIDYTLSESGGIDASGNPVASRSLWRSNVFYEIYGSIVLSFARYPTLAAIRVNYYDANYSHISRQEFSVAVSSGVSLTIPENAKYFKWTMLVSSETTISLEFVRQCYIMLNLGSTALPYEPYGFKLPPAVNGVEYPIYLGTVPTTRRIKKLVLTGEENISKIGVNAPYAYVARNVLQGSSKDRTSFICSHIPAVYYYQGENPSMVISDNLFDLYLNIGKELIELQPSGNTVAGLKEYLAAQYAAGKPVTVWYALAEPETAVVNEPLMKIGDYADTVSFAQAGVTIPTVSGANVLDVPTEVKPSEITIKGGIISV